jgi:hypothetical protein
VSPAEMEQGMKKQFGGGLPPKPLKAGREKK